MSNPSEADWKRMMNLIDDYYKSAECEPFREPVPWEAFGLTDYPIIIKQPMDLGTVKKKINSKKEYKTLYQCNEDVRLVWRNCMTYNRDGSDYYKLADKLNKKWEKDYNKLMHEVGDSHRQQSQTTTTANAADTSNVAKGGSSSVSTSNTNTTTDKVSLQEKRNMAKSLYNITKEDLGRVLVEIDLKCPAAIKRNAAEDELELNVDLITPPVMADIMKLIASMKGSTKKKPSGGSSKTKKQKLASASGPSVPGQQQPNNTTI